MRPAARLWAFFIWEVCRKTIRFIDMFAGNGVTVTVVEAIGRRPAAVDTELKGGAAPAT